MGFSLSWPNMALTKKLDLRPNWSQIGGEKNVEREGKSKRREEKEEEEKKKRRREGGKFKQSKRYGTNLGIDHMEFVWHSRKV